MTARILLGLALVLQSTLGTVCLVGTVYAASPAPAHDDALLSREVPMSFNVVTCAWVKTDDGWQPTPDSPCASGHCLKKEAPETSCVFAGTSTVMAIALPVSPLPEDTILTDDHPLLLPTDRPPDPPGIATVVLRE